MAARPTRGNQVDKYFATKRYARFVDSEIQIGRQVEFRTCDHFLHHLCCMKQVLLYGSRIRRHEHCNIDQKI